MATNIWFWVLFNAFVLGMLALDLGVFHRRAHVVRAREAAAWVGVWVALALLFCLGLLYFAGARPAATFLTGYLVEQALSVDNVFVIVMIFAYFGIPARYQHRVLFWGIIGALVMRGIFIGVGALLIQRFHWLLYVFGGILIATGGRMALQRDAEFDAEKNPVYRWARRLLPFTTEYDGQRFFTVANGRRVVTPLFLVLLLVEFTDLIFAVDSIPAIFGVTRDPFIVYTSNVFAILGLRSLFFLLAGIVNRFHLLKYGLAAILSFIGGKMVGEPWFEIPIGLSLAVVAGVLALAIALSLAFPRAATLEPHEVRGETGSVFGGVAKRVGTRDSGRGTRKAGARD
jgi:tellurite resistance protein TerC